MIIDYATYHRDNEIKQLCSNCKDTSGAVQTQVQ